MGESAMSERAQRRVDQLRSFRSRKEAMEELLQMGEEAVDPLVRALGHGMENVRWAAGHVLSQIGGPSVIARLIANLDDPARAEAASKALSKLTGQSFGTDRAAWTDWSKSPPPPPEPAPEPPAEAPAEPAPEPPEPTEPEPQPEAPAPERKPLTDRELVEAAIEGTDISVRDRSSGFVLSVPIGRGRTQRVVLNFTAMDFEDEPLIVVYTECAPANPDNYEWALRQNVRMSFGSIGIRDRAGQAVFVMVDTHHRATVAPEDLRKSILLLAQRGDSLEESLTHGDER